MNMDEHRHVRPKPLFVIGAHRSGTTWLSNLLSAMPEIYAPTDHRHRGVHESGFFSHLVPYCNGGTGRSDLLAIKYLFEKSDFFYLTGLKSGPDILQSGCDGYFRAVMDEAAVRHKAMYWLEKTPAHTLLLELLKAWFPDAVIIAVVRDYRQVVQSKLVGFGNPRSALEWFRTAAITTLYERIIQCSDVPVIHYDELQADALGVVRQWASRLGIQHPDASLHAQEQNSSYKETAPSLKGWQRACMLLGRFVVLCCPRSAMKWLVRRHDFTARASLPSWFFLIRVLEELDRDSEQA